METRANYTMIGAFTLAVLAAGFAFVYWFAGPQDTGGRKTYEIIFGGSVAGLRQGNTVLFNGIPVGQVTQLDLVPNKPNEVMVRVGIRNDVPVLADARAGLESQGLTGITAVSIRGGQAGAAALPVGPNGYPRITADASSGMAGLINTAQGAAARINVLLEAIDAEQIRTIVANFDKFTSAIGDKSTEVQNVIVQADQLTKQLNEVAKKVDVVVTNLQKASEDRDGLLAQATDAATSVRQLAENLDKRTALLSSEISRFTGPGLRQYEALASDGRRTLADVERVLRNFERNPRQFIFGGSSIPEFRR